MHEPHCPGTDANALRRFFLQHAECRPVPYQHLAEDSDVAAGPKHRITAGIYRMCDCEVFASQSGVPTSCLGAALAGRHKAEAHPASRLDRRDCIDTNYQLDFGQEERRGMKMWD